MGFCWILQAAILETGSFFPSLPYVVGDYMLDASVLYLHVLQIASRKFREM